jgi:L-lactate dehydrogenase complex protein LldG
MNEQQAFHQRLQASLAHRPAVGELPPPVDSPLPGDLMTRLATELDHLGAELIQADSARQAARLLGQITAPPTGPWFVADQPLPQAVAEYFPVEFADCSELAECQGALTEAQWVIADTGTVALQLNSRQPRSCYLLPEIHVAVATTDRLLTTLADALEQLAQAGPLPTGVVYVTGPSRTADIEKTIVIPAHGPKRMILILLPPDAET